MVGFDEHFSLAKWSHLQGKKIVRFFLGGGSWVSQVRSVAKSAGDPRFDAQMSYENFKVCNEVDFFAQELVWIKRTKRDLYRDLYIYRDVIMSPHWEPTK